MHSPSFPKFFIFFSTLFLLLGCEPSYDTAHRALASSGVENSSVGGFSMFNGCPENHFYNSAFSGQRVNSHNETIPVQGVVCCTVWDSCIVVYE